MIVLDASVLIAHLQARNIHSVRAAEILDTEDELVLHPLTLAECLVAPVRTGQELIFRSALKRLGIDTWVADPAHPYRLAHLRVETTLKLPDCCVLDVALNESATLATFDDRLAQYAAKMGVSVLGS